MTWVHEIDYFSSCEEGFRKAGQGMKCISLEKQKIVIHGNMVSFEWKSKIEGFNADPTVFLRFLVFAFEWKTHLGLLWNPEDTSLDFPSCWEPPPQIVMSFIS